MCTHLVALLQGLNQPSITHNLSALRNLIALLPKGTVVTEELTTKCVTFSIGLSAISPPSSETRALKMERLTELMVPRGHNHRTHPSKASEALCLFRDCCPLFRDCGSSSAFGHLPFEAGFKYKPLVADMAIDGNSGGGCACIHL